MSPAWRIGLGIFAVLQILGVAICALLAIWVGDERWIGTATVLLCTGGATLAAATFPGSP